MSLLLGYGAGVVNPYVAFETIDDQIRQGHITGVARDTAIEHYIKALNKGVLKVMSKMGISTLQSYCGAQIFEAIGLSQTFIDRYFTHTMSRVGGVGIDVIAEEVRLRHERAFGRQPVRPQELEAAAVPDGGGMGNTTCSTRTRCSSCSTPPARVSTRSSSRYTQAVDDQNQHRATLRGLFRFKPAGPAVPIEEVDSVEAIVKRFATARCPTGRSARRRTRRWRLR